MALFNKKKSQDAAAPATAPVSTSASSDDFSDFSPEALAAEPAAPDAKGGKGKKGAAKVDKKVGNGRGVKPGTAIGLNIGNDSIKVLEATSKGSDITVTAMGMVPTPADSLSNGVVMSANALVMGIRDAMTQAGIKSKQVVTSISGTGALVVRVVEVPKMSDGELLDNMKMDADRYIPFPPSEVEMDFKALRELPSDPDSPNMEVLLAAAQREIIDLHVQVIQDAKLDPRAIDVEPLATARALTHPLTTKGDALANGSATLGSDADYNDVSAILNIGAAGTEISILRGDILVFTRTVPTGGNAMTQALVDTLGLAWSDAEQLKREMGDALPPTGDGGTTAHTTDFGDTASGDDWSSFDENMAVATPSGTTSAAEGETFDEDFFAEGPSQKEPGEQHQQKEADDAAAKNTPDAAPFFNFGDETEPEEKMPTLDEGRLKSFADLLGEENDDMDELPTLTPDAPPATALPSAFDFPDEFIAPTVSSDADDRALPTLQGGAPTSTETVSDGSGVDAEDASVLPSEAAPAAAPFSFSFDAPTSASAPPAATPPAPAPATPEVTPAASLDAFDFGFETPATPAAPSTPAPVETDPFAEFMASAGDESTISTTEGTTTPVAATPAAAPATEDFDLDSIFNDDTATAGAATVAATGGDIDLGDFGSGMAGDDFSGDLADFGAGLGGASAGEIDAQTLHSVLSPVLDNLVNEVRRSLEYHTTRYPEAAVRRVTIVGGGAKLKNLDAYFTQQLGLPTTVGNPILRLGLNASKLPPGYVEENGPLFTVALGLAMRELTK